MAPHGPASSTRAQPPAQQASSQQASAARSAAASGSTCAATDWAALRAAAQDVAGRAYAPYSGYRVGAAAFADDGRLLTGCNVENAGYGVTLCAECGLVSSLVATGGGRLTAFVCVNGDGAVIMPCGRCRQLLWEHGGAPLLIETPQGVLSMADVLPQAFGSENLAPPT